MKTTLSICFSLFILTVSSNAQDIKALYRKMLPSVVAIYTEEQTISPYNPNQTFTSGGLGSGVLVSENGLILTAAHVIQTADNLVVEFEDGEQMSAEIVSSSPVADVALIKLIYPPKNKTIAKIGDSDLVEIGDQIMMVGNPLGLEFSLSVGYISGKRRDAEFSNGSPWVEYFQTDAAINMGNSGGPMFNMKGEVVGIASHILTQSGGFEGIGFAATTNICKELLFDEANPWTGIEAKYIGGPVAAILNIPQPGALLVQKVVRQSPAGKAGLKGGVLPFETEGGVIMLGGDIILEVNGVSTADRMNFEKILNSIRKDKRFELKVLRAGSVVLLTGEL